MQVKKFKSTFMFGAVTAAHQDEGNNVNSDCWIMENVPDSLYRERSLDAVDHYHKYREDIKILADAGLNAFRFSIEWARIEPTKGNFDKKEIEHYRDVLKCCHEFNVTPIVALHHFSSPKWLISEGGWESETTIDYFGNYCEYVVSELGDLMPYICTINEVNIGLQIGKLAKRMQRTMAKAFSENADERVKNSGEQESLQMEMASRMEKYNIALGQAFGVEPKDVHPFTGIRTMDGDMIIMKCHMKARQIIKELKPEIKVGVTFTTYDNQALPGGEEAVKRAQEEEFLHYLPYIMDDDFVGLQNYTRKIHGPDGIVEPEADIRMTKSGKEYYPEGLERVIRFVSKYWSKPIIISENGVSTDNDEERVEFIECALNGVYECLEEGINVIGYLYWSLLDNFEWQQGFEQKYGLIAVDRTTQTRYPKESLTFLGDISKSGLRHRKKQISRIS